MERVFEMTKGILEIYEKAIADMELVKAKLNNINHEAELNLELTQEQKLENYERLQEVLRERRKCKDIIDGVPRIFGEMEYVKQKCLRQEDYLRNRTYYPRDEE